jgi:hypothetical protein
MTIKDYYDTLSKKEKKEFRKKVGDKTQRNEATVYRWIKLRTPASYIEKNFISRLIGKPVDELFPEHEIAKS